MPDPRWTDDTERLTAETLATHCRTPIGNSTLPATAQAWREVVQPVLAALADAGLLVEPDDTEHVIEFRDRGWTIKHPLSCRPNLFDCPINGAAECQFGYGQLPEPGRQRCWLNDEGWLSWSETSTPEETR